MSAPARQYAPREQAHSSRALQALAEPVRLAAGTAPKAEELSLLPVGLTAEEILVIAVGRMDARSFWWRGSGQFFGWRRYLYKGLRLVFGVNGVQSLASERLETLRQFTCMVVRQDTRANACCAKLIDSGMKPEAISEAARRAMGVFDDRGRRSA